jgi:hypothetical protein
MLTVVLGCGQVKLFTAFANCLPRINVRVSAPRIRLSRTTTSGNCRLLMLFFDIFVPIRFIVAASGPGTAHRSTISLNAFSSYNVTIAGLSNDRREYVLLKPGDVNPDTECILVQLRGGRYGFDALRTQHTLSCWWLEAFTDHSAAPVHGFQVDFKRSRSSSLAGSDTFILGHF